MATEIKNKFNFRWTKGALNYWDRIEDILEKIIKEKARDRAKEKLVKNDSDIVTEEDLQSMIPEILDKLKNKVLSEITENHGSPQSSVSRYLYGH